MPSPECDIHIYSGMKIVEFVITVTLHPSTFIPHLLVQPAAAGCWGGQTTSFSNTTYCNSFWEIPQAFPDPVIPVEGNMSLSLIASTHDLV